MLNCRRSAGIATGILPTGSQSAHGPVLALIGQCFLCSNYMVTAGCSLVCLDVSELYCQCHLSTPWLQRMGTGCRQKADLEGQLQQERQHLHAMAQAVQEANSQHLTANAAMTQSRDCIDGFLDR